VRTYGARVTGLGRAGKIFWPKWEQAQKHGRFPIKKKLAEWASGVACAFSRQTDKNKDLRRQMVGSIGYQESRSGAARKWVAACRSAMQDIGCRPAVSETIAC
jgi:hypothetical protein